jgi:hypothetical protein
VKQKFYQTIKNQRMKKNILLFLFVSTAFALNAQKFKVTEGSLSDLKGETSFNVRFTYNNMFVGTKTESQFIADKTAEYNSKEPGKGTTWAKAWVKDRSTLFEPKFMELFSKSKFSITQEPQQYTLLFNTNFTEPGWNIGIARSSAYVSGTITVVETKNPSHVVAKISVERAPGKSMSGADYLTGPRIAEAYAVTGKKLPAFMKKQMK